MRKGDIFVVLLLLAYLVGLPSMMLFGLYGSGVAVAIAALILLFGFLGMFVFWIWMLVDAIRRPMKDKLVWILLLVLVSGIASFLYYALVYRKDLRETEAGQSEGSGALKVVLIVVLLLFLLIVGAIVVGVLVFIMMAPPPSIYCSSSNPTQINVVSNGLDKYYASPGEPLGAIVLVNITGSKMTDASCTGSGAFASAVPGCSSTINVGNFTLMPNAGSPETYSNSAIEISFTDAAGLEHSSIITCRGSQIKVS